MWNITDWQRLPFSDESRFVLGQADQPCTRGGALEQFSTKDNACPHTARVAQDFLRHFQTPSLAGLCLSPVEHVWDKLKRQMPSSHFARDF
ncbi:hypothetical protein TNCV_3325411 [Trichonephila clavipes]|nr:hypothetical protein TNCV_3325411 [Trichonephila clavipes]